MTSPSGKKKRRRSSLFRYGNPRIFDFHRLISAASRRGGSNNNNKQNPKRHYELENKEQGLVSAAGSHGLSVLLFLLGGFVLGQRDRLHDVPDDGGLDSEL